MRFILERDPLAGIMTSYLTEARISTNESVGTVFRVPTEYSVTGATTLRKEKYTQSSFVFHLSLDAIAQLEVIFIIHTVI
jgi:uncharacterized membrane protein